MEYIKDIQNWQTAETCAVTLGKFDGVHRGHRKLIERIHRLARLHGWKTAVFTFEIAPQVYMKERIPSLLMTNTERAEFLRDLDTDILVECPFTDAIKNMEAEDFVRDMLVERLHAAVVVAGTDFRFGKDRKGNAAFLKELGAKYHFQVEIIPKETDGEREISSTYIREELVAGRMEKVQELLGYPYYLESTIVHGRHLGHSLGFPTINQVPEPEKILPPRGVYVSRTYVGGKYYQGVSNIGVKPTVDGSAVGVETYLFDCSRDLYGQNARVELLSFRRPEQKFASIEELKQQMDRDIQGADQYFEKLESLRSGK
ncbi:MAG: bifunctional riboflavin kinase/FAD synthetase [Eubacteriales bacterium]|nr:bifunctional riboflavin kinase/FAD synthetase [Eubacteriales bacterium]